MLHPVNSNGRQDVALTMTVPGDQSNATFDNVDISVNYEVRVGTVTSDGRNSGPGIIGVLPFKLIITDLFL